MIIRDQEPRAPANFHPKFSANVQTMNPQPPQPLTVLNPLIFP